MSCTFLILASIAKRTRKRDSWNSSNAFIESLRLPSTWFNYGKLEEYGFHSHSLKLFLRSHLKKLILVTLQMAALYTIQMWFKLSGLINSLKSDLSVVLNWFYVSSLKGNLSKVQFMVLGERKVYNIKPKLKNL